MVSTSTLPPSRAAAVSAAAAATDVLPTPPEPQNTTTSRGREQRGERRRASLTGGRSRELLAERLGDHAGDPQPVVADEQVRQEQQRRGRPASRSEPRCTDRLRRIDTASRAASSTAVAPGARVLARAPPSAPASRSASNTASSAWVKSSGSTRFTITTPSGTSSSCRARATSSMVSLTGISSGDVTTLSAVSAGSESSSTIQSVWLRIGPTCTSSWIALRRVELADHVTGGGGVDHDEVPVGAARRATRAAPSTPCRR